MKENGKIFCTERRKINRQKRLGVHSREFKDDLFFNGYNNSFLPQKKNGC
jgi:hypothetical protein